MGIEICDFEEFWLYIFGEFNFTILEFFSEFETLKANFMQIEGVMRRLKRRFMMWLVWNVPLGRLAPWVLGLATMRKPRKREEGE